jgi:hypothetical protein
MEIKKKINYAGINISSVATSQLSVKLKTRHFDPGMKE